MLTGTVYKDIISDHTNIEYGEVTGIKAELLYSAKAMLAFSQLSY